MRPLDEWLCKFITSSKDSISAKAIETEKFIYKNYKQTVGKNESKHYSKSFPIVDWYIY